MKILAIYGSPRRHGNTSVLLDKAVQGAVDSGCEVRKVVLSELTMSPCLEIYGCKKDGRCVIDDDFQQVYDRIVDSNAIMLASPIFFYAVSAHTKILMDRCQSFWVKKNWVNGGVTPAAINKKGLFIAVGATHGNKLFDGALLSVRYFFQAIDTEFGQNLLFRGLDGAGEVEKHPEYLARAFAAGAALGSQLTMSLVQGVNAGE